MTDHQIVAAARRAAQWTKEALRPIHQSGLGTKEGDRCSLACDGRLYRPRVENCSCHISPPCHACTHNYLECRECGRVVEREEDAASLLPSTAGRWRSIGIGAEWVPSRPSRNLGDGKRIFDFDYDSSSGSTMVWRGKYEGPLTGDDIIKSFGDDTFGHRGPSLCNGTFTYTQITD